jgi:serine/threonine protein kinase
MVKGGKAIAAGGYGCVFNPALKCKHKERINGVSKLLQKRAANEEFQETTVIRPIMKTIPNNEDYIIFPTDMCEAEDLETGDLVDFDTKCSKFKDAKKNLNKYKILNMPFGGPDLKKYFTENIIGSNFITINNNLIKLIDNAIVMFNKQNLIHADLKSQNILVTPDELKCKIIDWGLAVKYPDNEFELLGELEWRPIQFNVPCSNILFSEFYQKKINLLEKQSESKSEMYDLLKNNFGDYKKKYGEGHVSYLSYVFQVIMDNLNIKDKLPEEIMFNYMTNCATSFQVNHGRNNYFDFDKYFREVYMYNCDIWGILVAYYELLTLSKTRFEFTSDDGKQIHQFRTKLSQILWNHMIQCDDKKINIDKLTSELRSLNVFFQEPAKNTIPKSSKQKSLKSRTTPTMTTTKPSNSILSKRTDSIKSLMKNRSTKKKKSEFSNTKKKRTRCPNGTRRNKKTGECESNSVRRKALRRCPKGTRKNNKGECIKKK